ncbi:ubiquitin-conjugating enzyme E2 6 [Drosophila persimilis]|uniref:ubiquitin-conjugating enzyme E2 6 n=1 Tax=Drosophila persimilis TaxID=7234 RepID=UPI000F079CE1|nr:ubiquitin-conjugating enzyme E2 6 [Drosophila persimilis]
MANAVVNTTSPMAGRRLQRDVTRLLASDHRATVDDNMSSLAVLFEGPLGTAYEGGMWTVNISMPKDYPLNPPKVRFITKILHPNIEFNTGLVCMNVFSQAWSPSYDLLNIIETFLPQLLRNPNPNDPLNHHAAQIMKHSEAMFRENVIACVNMYARPTPMCRRSEAGKQLLEQRSSDLSLSELLSDDDVDKD